nr:zinc finger, CCHC-type [Tanacetum cinerariifolium]
MVVAAMKHMASNFAKLDKFKGVDFKRWQKKMHFLLSSMSVVYVVTTLIPKDDGNNPTVEQVRKRAKWDNDDYVCRGLILNVICALRNPSRYNDNKGKRKHHDNTKADPNKKAKPTCWKCGKTGHIKRDFKGFNVGNKANGSGTKGLVDGSSNSLKAIMSTSKLNDSILCHARLGHVHFKMMQDMSKDGLISAFDMDTQKCKTCILTKITKKPFQNVKRETEVLELIHSNLCDLHAAPSLGNKKYFVTFIDDASRFCYVYLLYTKDEALDKFKVFKTEVEVQQGSLIKRFRTDRGREYMNTLYFQYVGIIHETNAFYTPQQNGISEKKNKLLKEMVNSMLSYSGLSQGFWGKAMVVVRLPDPKLKTLGKSGIECIFVGYAEYSKAFRFYVIEPNDPVSINFIIESKDVISDENRFSTVPRPSQMSLEQEMGYLTNTPIALMLRMIPRHLMKQRNLRMLLSGKKQLMMRWNPSWTTTLRCWLIYFQGFRQKSGIVYFDTYAPVVRISTIKLLTAMASIHNMFIHQMDVKTNLLNGELEKEVYMNQPQGFIMPNNENKLCKLIKSLYGLKQAPKQWHQKFDEVVLSNGYLLNQADKYESLSSRFSMKDMREAAVILVSTHMNTSKKLMPNNDQAVSQFEHSKVIGCLMYVMTCTRPDIAFDVGKLSRYNSNPVLEGYTDASWISNTEENSSTSGWVFLLGGAVGKEAEWLKNLLLEIPL